MGDQANRSRELDRAGGELRSVAHWEGGEITAAALTVRGRQARGESEDILTGASRPLDGGRGGRWRKSTPALERRLTPLRRYGGAGIGIVLDPRARALGEESLPVGRSRIGAGSPRTNRGRVDQY